MTLTVVIIVSLICLLVGFASGFYFIARDPDIIRLADDEMITKKPPSGLVLVAVTPEIMRRLIIKKTKSDGTIEARDLYRDDF